MNSNPFRNFLTKAIALKEPVYFYIALNVVMFVVGFLLIATTAFRHAFVGVPLDETLLADQAYTLVIYHLFHNELFQLAFNMLMLFWLGSILSDYLKPRHFHFIYIGGGIIAAVISIAVYIFLLPPSKPFLLGSTGSVMAIAVAAATIVPDYSMRLLLFGWVKLKYLVLVVLALDLLVMVSNPSGSLAIGGGLVGFVFVKLWKSGTDLTALFRKKSVLKVVKNKQAPTKKQERVPQQDIDAILDKISRSGYDNLTREEKQLLFKASKNDG